MDESESNDDASKREAATSRLTFVKIARRLCDKGCVALALASLSSQCPNLRRVAICALGLFSCATQTKEARDLTSWRERPQLAMVMDSVQRALTLRCAMHLARNEKHKAAECQSHPPVSMLPAVSAVFLAKAVLVVTKPGDDMFNRSNQIFLSQSENHGAFKDCFDLPAFISLFCCNMSEEPRQALTERIWALYLLKDGVQDEFSFRVASRRHVQALLLTSLDSHTCRRHISGVGFEQTLLLETMHRLLVRGGRPAFSHLVSNMGILSWIRGILLGRKSFALQTVDMCCQLLEILNTTVAQIQERLEDEVPIEHLCVEALNLAGPVVCLCNNVSKGGVSGRQSTLLYMPLLESVCCYLKALRPFVASVQQSGLSPENGVRLSSAMEFIADTKGNEVLFRRSLGSFCTLPLSADCVDEDAIVSLCDTVFSFILRQSDDDHHGMYAVMLDNRS